MEDNLEQAEQPSSPSAATAGIELEEKPEAEARRSSSLKSALKYARRARQLWPELDGISTLITALKILRASPTDHYKILRIEPFAHIIAIKKQYKSRSHSPSRQSGNPVPAAEDAFKRIADSFLSFRPFPQA
ncbi:hypothetical protein HPP92_007647 [Vanilla planifolia]|uniref:Uncharacterized protein n=1 Tax=Vanilla planifolia TaxID=51239 RepID=A0A835RKM7_VANPL|nr:hypothetical protein HPP92_007647 [Vanilla planifolia]